MFQPIRMYHVTVSTYSTNVPWSCDKSRLSIHIMWSIPQSRDVQSRKLKAIKYSVCDSVHPGVHFLDSQMCRVTHVWCAILVTIHWPVEPWEGPSSSSMGVFFILMGMASAGAGVHLGANDSPTGVVFLGLGVDSGMNTFCVHVYYRWASTGWPVWRLLTFYT